MMLPVYFMAELSLSIMCLVAAATLMAVGRALIAFLRSRTPQRRRRHGGHGE